MTGWLDHSVFIGSRNTNAVDLVGANLGRESSNLYLYAYGTALDHVSFRWSCLSPLTPLDIILPRKFEPSAGNLNFCQNLPKIDDVKDEHSKVCDEISCSPKMSSLLISRPHGSVRSAIDATQMFP